GLTPLRVHQRVSQIGANVLRSEARPSSHPHRNPDDALEATPDAEPRELLSRSYFTRLGLLVGQEWANQISESCAEPVSELRVGRSAPRDDVLRLQVKMDAVVSVLIVGARPEVISTTRVDDGACSFNDAGFVVHGRPGIRQVRDGKLAPRHLLLDPT